MIARDPIRFPRRYPAPADAEVAAVFAALLAFGRVELFGAVLERVFEEADRAGGPAAWVDAGAPRLDGVYYRWFDEEDLRLLARTLGEARRRHGSLGALFMAGPARAMLDDGVGRFAECVPEASSRAFRTWLARPRDGSACKRWNMLLRWMVGRDEVDLGLWTHLRAADLVMPLDTHVSRIARLLGLTSRPTADWRAAEEVTAALADLDPADPVRFDFALAHLGISGECQGAFVASVCPGCPLQPVCAAALRGPVAPGSAASARPRARRLPR